MRYRVNWRLAIDGRVFEAGDILPAELDPPARLVGGVLTVLDDSPSDATPGDAPPEPTAVSRYVQAPVPGRR